MRVLKPEATPDVVALLDQLARPADEVRPVAYQEAMAGLGEAFAAAHAASLRGIARLLLVCTNEDADYLARGVLDGLTRSTSMQVTVACFWNEREVVVGKDVANRVDVAPIARRYVEPGAVDAMLVVKSIISSACVVRTNITELVYERDPGRVLVFAPVVYKGAEARVSAEFSPEVSSKFEFYSFAEDDEKVGDNIVPGIGGQVYERLGIGPREVKNRYSPALVKERRALAG